MAKCICTNASSFREMMHLAEKIVSAVGRLQAKVTDRRDVH